MSLSNLYNFRNTIRHFINIDDLYYPSDVETFDCISQLCWTKPVPFRVYKADDRYRVIKMPNILNFIRAYHYYKGLDGFSDVQSLDAQHKRLAANLDTGDFVAGNYDSQLNDDFVNLCNYDVLIKLDISEYYGRIYTHYLGLSDNELQDKPLAWLNNGRTSGLLMGNYLSLYFAEVLSSKISEEIQLMIDLESINCAFNYFSDDFYFFCNEYNIENVVNIFDKALEKYDFVRKNKKEKWDYESYNKNNLLTRYWKATIRSWNLEVLKDNEIKRKHPEIEVSHKLSFLNQLVYRLSGLPDEKSKRSFITNFFKTKHFQTVNYNEYTVKEYDLHQLFFLIKYAPESLLYISHIISQIPAIVGDKNTKQFFNARYKESLKHELHDVQLYYFYAIKCMGYTDLLPLLADLVMESENQPLVSYYLKENYFLSSHISALKLITGEEYWFQNYNLILYTPELLENLNQSIEQYLIPEKLNISPNYEKERKYKDFYIKNLQNRNSILRDIADVTLEIKNYLHYRYEETAENFNE